jgi:hypothetical protein
MRESGAYNLQESTVYLRWAKAQAAAKMTATQQQAAVAGQPQLASHDEEMVALRRRAEKIKKEGKKKRLREDAEIVISTKMPRLSSSCALCPQINKARQISPSVLTITATKGLSSSKRKKTLEGMLRFWVF